MSATPEEKPRTRGSVTAAALRKSLQRLYIATTVLYVALILFAVYVWQSGQNTTDALCSLRNDQVTRLSQSIEFLQENPGGIPGLATKDDLVRSIAGQQSTILALQKLHCDSPARVPTIKGQPAPANNP